MRIRQRALRLSIALALLGVTSWSLAVRGNAGASHEVLGFMVLATLVTLLQGRLSRRAVFWSASCVLGFIAVASLYVSVLSASRWHVAGQGLSLDPLPGQQEIHGRRNGAVAAFRRWRAVQPGVGVVVSGAITLRQGLPGRDWYVGPSDRLTAESGSAFTVLEFDGTGQYAYRSAFLDGPIKGRSFSAAVEIRAHGDDVACGYVALGEHGTGPKSLERVCIGDEWEPAAVDWRASDGTEEVRVDVVLSHFDRPVRVRSAEVWALGEPHAELLAPLAPTNATVRVSWGLPWPTHEDASREVRVVVPLERDQEVRFEVAVPRPIPSGSDVWTSVHLEEGLVAVMEPLVILPRATLVPAPYPNRQELWFGDPNRLGHTAAAVFAAAFVTAPTSLAALLVGMSAVPPLAVSGSRTGYAAAVLVALASILARGPGANTNRGSPDQRAGPRAWHRCVGWIVQRRGAVLIALSVAAAMAAVWVLPSIVGGRSLSLDEPSFAVRRAIWGHAITLLPDAPLEVLERDFEASWRALHGDLPNAAHAHNGLLDALLRFGFAGTVALIASGAALFWRRRPAHLVPGDVAVALLVLLVLNAPDVAYLSWWVLVPLLLLTLDRRASSGPGRAP